LVPNAGLLPAAVLAQRLDLAGLVDGRLRLAQHELTVGCVDRFLKAVASKHEPAAAKMNRSVLSGMCSLAARHDVLDRNPVRDAAGISVEPKRSPRALTLEEVRLLRERLAADEQAVARDLPDLVGFLLATGMRIGEASALTWDAVHLAKPATVGVRGAIVRIRGTGLLCRSSPKTKAGARTLVLPS